MIKIDTQAFSRDDTLAKALRWQLKNIFACHYHKIGAPTIWYENKTRHDLVQMLQKNDVDDE